jgi:hypothetical protein
VLLLEVSTLFAFLVGLALVACVTEGVGPLEGLARLWRRSLGRGRWRRTTVLGLALGSTLVVPQLAVQYPLLYVLPRAAVHVLVGDILPALFAVYVLTVTVVAAADARLRADGVDIERDLDAARGYANTTVNASPTAISPGVTTSQ